jgi:MerR family copper efflux transcriptional regulator
VATLTIHEAAQTTGWSARMLRYIEEIGLVESPRSPAGYRLYGPAQLQRLRTLKELLDTHGLELGDVGFALRLRKEPALTEALDEWFEATPRKPVEIPDADWLAFELDKHQSLLTTAPAKRSTA